MGVMPAQPCSTLRRCSRHDLVRFSRLRRTRRRPRLLGRKNRPEAHHRRAFHRPRPRGRRLPHVALRRRAEAALDDALRLSRAMSYKNAMADLELGGGKAVIIGDSRTQKTPALFEAFGRAVEQRGRPLLDGRGRRRLAGRPDARPQAHPLRRRPRGPSGRLRRSQPGDRRGRVPRRRSCASSARWAATSTASPWRSRASATSAATWPTSCTPPAPG